MLVRIGNNEYDSNVGDTVYALYQGTTVFYKGTVKRIKQNIIDVEFMNEDESQPPDVKPVEKKYVIPALFIEKANVQCGSCNKSISLTSSTTHVKCNRCAKVHPLHPQCLTSFIRSMRSKKKPDVDDVMNNYNLLPDYICIGCTKPCFICGHKHSVNEKNALLYSCSFCNQNPKSTCVIIHVGGNSKIGCAYKTDEVTKDKFLEGSLPCRFCKINSHYTYNRSKFFHDNISEQSDKALLNIVKDDIFQNIFGEISKDRTFKTLDKCKAFVSQYLSHLDANTENSLAPNVPTNDAIYGLFLPPQSLNNFLSPKAIVDEYIMNAVSFLLNGWAYERIYKYSMDTEEDIIDYNQFGYASRHNSICPKINHQKRNKDSTSTDVAGKTGRILKTSKEEYSHMVNVWKKDLFPIVDSDREFAILQRMLLEKKKCRKQILFVANI